MIPFPVSNVGGMVTPNDDGTFSVYLNERVDDARKRKALRHELQHIVNGDFWNDRAIEEMEDI